VADAWPEQAVPGVVSFIAPAVDSSRGTIDVHISVLADDAKQRNIFLQGMTVSANIIAAERERTLVLPNDYLLTGSAGQTQVLRWLDGAVSALDVQPGMRNMTHSETPYHLTRHA